jgi:hypothetical protein
MPETKPHLDRHLWEGRFALYSDADLLAWWGRAGEEPSAVDEVALAEIEKRGLDI